MPKWIKPELVNMYNPRVAKVVRFVIERNLPDKALMGLVLSMYISKEAEC